MYRTNDEFSLKLPNSYILLVTTILKEFCVDSALSYALQRLSALWIMVASFVPMAGMLG